MNLQVALDRRAQVAEFQRKHRVGLVTLVFTDIVGSTRLKQDLGDEEAVVLIKRHHALVRELLAQFKEGEEIGVAGDSFFIVFSRPSDALRFCLLLQKEIRALAPGRPGGLADRVGVHVGEVIIEERADGAGGKDLYGIQVDTCARVMSLAAGHQILLSRTAFDNARQVLRGEQIPGLGELSWLNHGFYLMKGVEEPVEIGEVGEVGSAKLEPPKSSEKARRFESLEIESVLGWRPAVGQLVPRTQWVLEEKLGEGGFGEVWRACLPALRTQRVFKFCFRADRVRSLRREVAVFRQLRERLGDHPNIVGLTDLSLEEPPFYLAMEHVGCKDLKAWCQSQGGVAAVPLGVRLEIVAQIAEALGAAHGAGVIHRDVKPSNILLVGAELAGLPEGPPPVGPRDRLPAKPWAKLTDFGIGRVTSEETLRGLSAAGLSQPSGASGLAQSGTQLYMAPELVAGKSSSIQSDIYALGVVLMQFIAGDFSRPVTTDWYQDIADPALRECLRKCFAGKPEERFEAAGQLALRLREIARQHPVPGERPGATRPSPGPLRPWPVALRVAGPVVALVILLAFAAWLWRRGEPRVGVPELPARKHLAVLPFQTVGADAKNLALSEGLVETVAARLAGLERHPDTLHVIPMSEVRGEAIKSARQARDLFGATLVLTGSVQREGDQLRITVSLVDSKVLHSIHSTTLDGPIDAIYQMQDDISRLASGWLGLALPPGSAPAAAFTQSKVPGVYELYLQGTGYLARYDRAENLDQAVWCFQAALEKDTNFAPAHAALGQAYWRKYQETYEPKWVAEAGKSCRRALDLNGRLASAHVTLGLIHTGTGKPGQAIDDFKQALQLEPANRDALRALARAQEKLGQTEPAELTLKSAIAGSPNYWAGYNDLGVFYFRFGRYAEAEVAFLRVVELTPDNYVGYRNLGGLYTLMGRYAEAKARLQRSLDFRPTAEAFSNLGTVEFFEAHYVESARHYQQAIAFRDNHHTTWGNLADAYRLTGTQTGEAVEAYGKAMALAEKALGIDPVDAEVRASLAVYCLGRAETNRALTQIEQALRVAPDNVNVLFMAALVYERAGQRAVALTHLAKAAQGGYSSAEVQRHPDLATLRNDPGFATVVSSLQTRTKNSVNKPK